MFLWHHHHPYLPPYSAQQNSVIYTCIDDKEIHNFLEENFCLFYKISTVYREIRDILFTPSTKSFALGHPSLSMLNLISSKIYFCKTISKTAKSSQ